MPKILKPLTEREVKYARKTTAVGGVPGLSVKVHTSKTDIVSRFYDLRASIKGERLYYRIGDISSISLADARLTANSKLAEWKQNAAIGISNLKTLEQPPKKNRITVEQLYNQWIQAQIERGRWSGPTGAKTVNDMISRFTRYLPVELRNKQADELTALDIANVIRPRWTCVNQSCARMCNTLANAYSWGIRFQVLPAMINPALLNNGLLGDLLPIHDAKIGHMGALPVEKIPDFFHALLNCKNAISPTALFIAYSILTASRPGSILPSVWNEINFSQKLHIIPRERMKIKGIHFDRITPLSSQAISVLRDIPRRATSELIFASQSSPQHPITQESYGLFIKRMCRTGDWHDPYQTNRRGQPARMTLHGTGRATFKDWAKDAIRYDHAHFDESLIERCLDHSEGYNGAYVREQPIGDMRAVFEAWGNFCYSKIV